MPRRPPAQVRARRPIRQQRPVPQISRVSAHTSRAIAEFERARLYPGEIADALARWTRFVHGPARVIADYEFGASPCPCCTHEEPDEIRKVLHRALHALPARAARELLGLVRPLDELYLSRSIAGPENAGLRALLAVT